MSSKKSEVMIYPQTFTQTEKAIARSNIGAIGPLEVTWGNSAGYKTISWSTADSGNSFNKVIGNLGLTEAGNYLVFFDAMIASSTNSGELRILVNTGEGTAGEIDYNMTVGNELIALLREECVKTDLEEVTPLQIAAKTAQIIPMLQTGSFREAGQLIDTLEPDEFFTVERLAKYKDMLAAADVIKYSA